MSDLVTHLLSVIVVVGNGLLAGVLFAVAISVIPAAAALPPDRYVQLHQSLGQNYDPTMQIIAGSAVVSDALLAAWLGPTTAARVLCGAGCVLLIGVAAVSQTQNVPINRQVRVLTDGRIPDDWVDPRPEWGAWHRVRTVLAVLALVANAGAISWSR